MKKVLIGVVAVVAVLVLGFLGFAATRPSDVHVERSLVIAVAPSDVWPHVSDVQKFFEWSPWSAVDPDQETTFSDTSSGVGAVYSWKGNKDVGVGSMTITAAETDRRVDLDLAFVEPWESNGEVSFLLSPVGAGTQVIWTYDEHAGFMMKVMGIFMSMDEMLGADYEKGLASLDATVLAAVAPGP
jgi:hypothetical protein